MSSYQEPAERVDGMSEIITQQYIVPGDDFTRAGEASGALKKSLKQIGFPPEAIRRATISMYEGEINMVIHAQGGVIDTRISPDRVEMWLRDHGPGIENVELAMQEGYSTAPDHVRSLGFGAGMGLPNIKKYTDEMKIDTASGKGTTVYMMVKIHS